MWFFFGIFTLIGATILGLKVRLAAAWSGFPDTVGKYTFDLQEIRNKDRLALVRLGMKAPAGLHFRVRAERPDDRLYKWLGVTCEIQTRDIDFDRKVYVESDARATAILLKRNVQLRAALFNVFAYAKSHRLRRMRVRCANKRVWMEFSPKVEHDLFAAKNYLAPLLQTISAGLACLDLPIEYRRDRFVWRASAALGFSTATLALGVVGLIRSTGRTDILEPGLLFAACVIPALLASAGSIVFLLAWLIASSRAHTVIFEFALAGGLGLLLSTYALAREANMEFDFYPATRHVVTDVYTEHRVRRGRRGRTHHSYYMNCADWRRGYEGHPLRLEIDSRTYALLQGSHAATVYARPGLFHFAWVERIDPASW
jgi:hypothetical protein